MFASDPFPPLALAAGDHGDDRGRGHVHGRVRRPTFKKLETAAAQLQPLACACSGGKRSDAPLQNPASSSQSGICAAVTSQSGKVIGVGAALDCQGGVPLCALPLCSFKAARAFLSCRFGVPEQSVAKAIAALTSTIVNQLTLSLRQLT